jgi:hypothetical protein
MPEDAPVTSAFWPLSFRSIGQDGITTGGNVGSSIGGKKLLFIICSRMADRAAILPVRHDLMGYIVE